MAIKSELIGKLGGADVEVTPVDVTASGWIGSEVVMRTIEVPAGETWLVAAHGNLQSAYAGGNAAQLVIGTTKMPTGAPNGIIGMAHVGAGTIKVRLLRNNANGSDHFTGHVYAVKN